MTDDTESVTETGMEQIKIVLNSIYLCLAFAMKHIAEREGEESAAKFKESMLNALRNGDIDMALLEESKTYEFVVAKIEALGRVEA